MQIIFPDWHSLMSSGKVVIFFLQPIQFSGLTFPTSFPKFVLFVSHFVSTFWVSCWCIFCILFVVVHLNFSDQLSQILGFLPKFHQKSQELAFQAHVFFDRQKTFSHLDKLGSLELQNIWKMEEEGNFPKELNFVQWKLKTGGHIHLSWAFQMKRAPMEKLQLKNIGKLQSFQLQNCSNV